MRLQATIYKGGECIIGKIKKRGGGMESFVPNPVEITSLVLQSQCL